MLYFVCRAKEGQYLGNLEQLRGQAQQSADIAAAKQAELQLAKQQYDAERQKGLPMEQDIERYHKSVQEKVFIYSLLHLASVFPSISADLWLSSSIMSHDRAVPVKCYPMLWKHLKLHPKCVL